MARWVRRRMQEYGLSCSARGLLKNLVLWCVLGTVLFFPGRESFAEAGCTRIVSLAPSVTELLFDLGLGPRVVGVSAFCRYPPEARAVPKVGGFLDLNVEQIVARKPTSVFGLQESVTLTRPLERFSLTLDLLDHTSLAGIRASYNTVAARCGVQDRARERLTDLEGREASIRARCASESSTPPKRVMVVVGRTREGSSQTGVYVSGHDGFYSDIVALLGGVNVHQGRTVAVPTLSAEGIMKLAPDVIIDILNEDDEEREADYREFWGRFPSVPAVRQGRVVVVRDDFASIPGPRYILLAEKLHRILCNG